MLVKLQLTILSQSKTVITNLDDEAHSFDASCVQALVAHMDQVVSAEDQQRPKALLEARAQEGLIAPSFATRLVTYRGLVHNQPGD